MFTISRETQFCYGHRLLHHPGRCRRLHGHNGRVRILLSAPLNTQGMVLDFGEIRETFERWIDENLDHHTLLEEGDPLVEALRQAGEEVVVMASSPTAENIAHMLFEKAQNLGLPVVEVSIWETPKCRATYRE
ncbi:MAG: 6-carboxytetrahydropterin synthase [Planctomycetia bacterium]|nr:6-carboxytetrahydropterin synthase [Planctomycetia bacterium]